MSDVGDTLRELHEGKIALEEAEDRFRNRRWPPWPAADLADPETAYARRGRKPRQGIEEVAHAWDVGLITREQFDRLEAAACEAEERFGPS